MANQIFKPILTTFVILLFIVGCDDTMTSQEDIMNAQSKLETQVLDLPGVVGVAIGACADKACLKVFVEMNTPELKQQIPEQIDGFKVEVEETGPVQIQD